MAEIGKFVFTAEGKRMIVAQDGGIHFAVMGAVLLNNPALTEDKVKTLTWEQLKSGELGTLGLRSVSYIGKDGNILPQDDLAYNDAIENIFAKDTPTENTYLFDCMYHPDMGTTDQEGNCYGLYEFNFNKTLFIWSRSNQNNEDDDPSFNAIIVLGKQYVTDKDSTYSVEDSQKPTVIGALVSTPIEGSDRTISLIDFMTEQNEYVEFKFQWRITFTDNPVTEVNLTADELSDINDRFQLTNNGVKTDGSINLNITTDDAIIHEFNLNENGNFATSKSVMVAQVVPSEELDFPNNAEGLINTVNAGQKDEARMGKDAYKNHRVLQSFAYEGNITDIGETTITAATVVETLRSTEPMDQTHPIYTPLPLNEAYNNKEKFPVYETRAFNANVSLFGVNEFIHTTGSRALFSDNNLRLYVNTDNKANFICSNNNFEYNSPYNDSYICSNGNTGYNSINDNFLANSNNNLLHDVAKYTTLIASDNNIIYNNASACMFIKSNDNSASDSNSGSLFIGSNNCYSYNSDLNTIFFGTHDSTSFDSSKESIFIGGYGNTMQKSNISGMMISTKNNSISATSGVTIINGCENGYESNAHSFGCNGLRHSVLLNSRYTDTFNSTVDPYSNKTIINGIGIKGNAVSIHDTFNGNEVYFGQYNAKASADDNDLMPIIIGGGRDDVNRYNALTFELLDTINEGAFNYRSLNNYLGRLKTDIVYCTMGLSSDIAEINSLSAGNISTTNLMINDRDITNYISDNVIDSLKNKTINLGTARIALSRVDVSDLVNAGNVYDKSKVEPDSTIIYGSTVQYLGAESTALFVSGTDINATAVFPNIVDGQSITIYNDNDEMISIHLRDNLTPKIVVNPACYVELRKIDGKWYGHGPQS